MRRDNEVSSNLRSILNSRKVSKKSVHELVSVLYDNLDYKITKKEMVELFISALFPKKRRMEDRAQADTCLTTVPQYTNLAANNDFSSIPNCQGCNLNSTTGNVDCPDGSSFSLNQYLQLIHG